MTDEELDAALGGLRAQDIDGHRRERIRQRSHRALQQEPRTGLRRIYFRILEPAFVAAVCVVHIVWAFQTAVTILVR